MQSPWRPCDSLRALLKRHQEKDCWPMGFTASVLSSFLETEHGRLEMLVVWAEAREEKSS